MKDPFKPGLLLVLLLCFQTTIRAQGTLSVISTNDGNGQFSWTFSAATSVSLDHFQMKLYGVQESFSPVGWAGVISEGDIVTWSYLGGGGSPFTGSPMTIAIRSTSTQSIPYGGIGNTTYPDGLSWGNTMFVRFAYEGPIQVPEPSQGSLWLVAGGILGIARLIKFQLQPEISLRRAG